MKVGLKNRSLSMAVTVSQMSMQLKSEISQSIDLAFEKTLGEMNWPYTEHEQVSFYDLMKIFQNLKINLKQCLNSSVI
jgi:hypothetical protein